MSSRIKVRAEMWSICRRVCTITVVSVVLVGLLLPVLPTYQRPLRIERDITILDAHEDELVFSQLKLTWLGSQYRSIGTVVLATPGYKILVESFASVHIHRRSYPNDSSLYTDWAPVAAGEVHRILCGIRDLLMERERGEDMEPVSVSIMRRRLHMHVGCEFRVAECDADELYRGILDALDAENSQAREIVARQHREVNGKE